MRNAKVIEFPKAQSTRKRMQDKAQEQKAVLVLSIASVLIMTVFLNQWLVKGPETSLSSNNRNVASFEPATFAKDVKWEHHLARELASNKTKVDAKLAEAPTVRDELIFGYLEGKYGMKLNEGRIESLQFIDAQAGEQPMDIKNKIEFLNKYAGAFGLGYSEASSAPANSESEQVYNLIDASKRIVGTAHFVTDDEGRVSSIKFQQ